MKQTSTLHSLAAFLVITLTQLSALWDLLSFKIKTRQYVVSLGHHDQGGKQITGRGDKSGCFFYFEACMT